MKTTSLNFDRKWGKKIPRRPARSDLDPTQSQRPRKVSQTCACGNYLHRTGMQCTTRPAARLVRLNHELLRSSIPVFLCPALLRPPRAAPLVRNPGISRRSFTISGLKCSTIRTEDESQSSRDGIDFKQVRALPPQCPGCGARTQVVDPGIAGHYDLERKAVQSYLNPEPPKDLSKEAVYQGALETADQELLKGLGLSQDVAGAYLCSCISPTP
jgi:genetic interactor of prohibitins 3, mitochondrial